MEASMHTVLRHELAMDESLFWQWFFDENVNRENYLGRLGFPEFEIVRLERHADGRVERVVKAKPRMKMPRPVQALFGNSAAYEEHGNFDPSARRWQARCVGALTDRVVTTIAVWIENAVPGRLEQVIELEVTANVPGLGKLIENAIMKQTVELFETTRDYTRERITALQRENTQAGLASGAAVDLS
jgi:hypothetical protein